MNRSFFEREMMGLERELRALHADRFTPLALLQQEMQLIRSCQQRVQDFAAAHPFAAEADEIEYHKQLYPVLRAMHIFRAELYLLKKGSPALYEQGDSAAASLQLIAAFIRRYEFLYFYFKWGANELDGLFFTRSGNSDSVLQPVLPEPSAGETTEAGYVFARFLAYEQLFSHIAGQSSDRQHPFRWTGETVNLIELLHGIHLTGQVNDGKVGVVEFFKGMGEFFGVDVGIPKKGLDALMKRKKLSRTHFSERLRDSLHQRMDEEDDWEREKRLKNKTLF